MPTFAWIDHSERQRRQILEAIDLFREKDTRDELGIAGIRDALSDMLFPGTGALQTRARYFFFVPWMYLGFEAARVSSAEVARKGRAFEIGLIDRLADSSEPAGTIGIQARSSLQWIPSSIYWNGLKLLRICQSGLQPRRIGGSGGLLPDRMTSTGLTEADFRRLGATASESAAVDCLRNKIDQLVALVNGLQVARTVVGQRGHFRGRERIAKFFQDRGDYVHGGAGHWYVYNWGGRWEPQFNVGMFGLPGGGYIRAGLGFNLTKASTDPDRDTGMLMVRSLFSTFQSLARTSLRDDLIQLLDRPRSIVEHGSTLPDSSLVKGADATKWLSTLNSPELEGWIFMGRALKCDRAEDRQTLEDIRSLAQFVGEEFEAWHRVWTRIWAAS